VKIALGSPDSRSTLVDLILPCVLALCVAASLLVLFGTFAMTKVTLAVALGIPTVALLILDFELTVLVFVGLLFSMQDAGVVKAVVPFVAILVLSFFVTHKGVRPRDFLTPLTGGLMVFLITMIPSLVNSPDLLMTFVYLQNPVAIALVVLILGAAIVSQRQCKRYLAVFMVLAMANSLVVIAQGMQSGRREVGFAGLVFVDFVAVAILIAVNYALFHRGVGRLAGIAAVMIAGPALMFTQTRNPMISLGVCLVVYGGYLFRNNHLLGISKRRLSIGAASAGVLAVLVVVAVVTVFPHVIARVTDLRESSGYEIRSIEDFSLNSMVTRVLIWLTAWNAFLAHPVVGIGAYSFPFASAEYFTIPPMLYVRFVRGLSPHITYLASLVETGVIGLAGFLVFLGTSLRVAVRSVGLSAGRDERFVSTTIFILQLYIAVSMLMTDAWLWSQCGMLWALVLGMNAGNSQTLARAHA